MHKKTSFGKGLTALVPAGFLMAVLLLPGCSDGDLAVPTAKAHQSEDDSGVMVVDTLGRDAQFLVLKFHGSDTLYLWHRVESRSAMGHESLAPFLKADGSPVTHGDYVPLDS